MLLVDKTSFSQLLRWSISYGTFYQTHSLLLLVSKTLTAFACVQYSRRIEIDNRLQIQSMVRHIHKKIIKKIQVKIYLFGIGMAHPNPVQRSLTVTQKGCSNLYLSELQDVRHVVESESNTTFIQIKKPPIIRFLASNYLLKMSRCRLPVNSRGSV